MTLDEILRRLECGQLDMDLVGQAVAALRARRDELVMSYDLKFAEDAAASLARAETAEKRLAEYEQATDGVIEARKWFWDALGIDMPIEPDPLDEAINALAAIRALGSAEAQNGRPNND